ncbi:MAG: amidohydrolase family protein, partial [Lentisphaeria bacterium]|nr:amidohydrolase family protein [Lentisphaeria bacterium]
TMVRVPTVDCHSHTLLRGEYRRQAPFSLFSLTSYFERDLQATAGGPIYADTRNDAERWERLRPVLEKARNVSYWRHNLLVYRELFGLREDELEDGNWSAVNDAIRARTSEPGWYEHVTREVCGLRTQIRNVPWFESWEPEFFTAVLRMEPALQLYEPATRLRLEEHLGRSIGTLAEAKDALHALTAEYAQRGAVGIKLAHAYRRTLHSEPVPETRAAHLFDRALHGAALHAAEAKAIEDHFVFTLAELAREMGLVFQIHTGVQGNWGNVPDSDPLLLIPLLGTFRDVRFDLFHAGYPYCRELGMLGKHFPNVWLNMAWMYLVSTSASRNLLGEWIDLVPAYRLLGFGSDVRFPEMIFGHLEMARQCVADVIADKVEHDFLSREEGIALARRMFHDNAVELYGLDRKACAGAPAS